MKKGIARRQQADRQERIDQILAAGRRLFLEKGYLGATVRDIALEAELSTGTLYFYFKGKDEIYGKICEEAFHILLGLFRRAVAETVRPMERLEALSRAYVKFYAEYPDYFDILSFRDMGFKKVGLSAAHLERIDRLSGQVIAILNDVVEEGMRSGDIHSRCSSMELTITLWAGLEGLFSLDKRGYLKPSGLDLHRMASLQARTLFKGVKAG
ncbi:MAG: TetR/AcrR family transcriptional regulator [Desulfobacterales bacterium]|nr:TetR/AcrR family transcriptional regulator [Desulfobacterales bacterium]